MKLGIAIKKTQIIKYMKLGLLRNVFLKTPKMEMSGLEYQIWSPFKSKEKKTNKYFNVRKKI